MPAEPESPASTVEARPSMCQLPGGLGASGSLVFSLEQVEDGSHHTQAGRDRLQAQLSLLAQHVQGLLAPQDGFHRRLERDVRLFLRVTESQEDDELDAVLLASKLSSAGYRVSLRSALGGGAGTSCFHNLRNEFLVVQGEAEAEGGDFIVELNFREHFGIPHATERYSGLLALVPRALVATRRGLPPLVQLLCSEMSLAFEAQGLSLPPWRQPRSLLSKWLPSKVRDVDLSPYGSPRASSPELPPSMLAPPNGLGTGPPSGSDSPPFGGGASPRAVLHGASAALGGARAAPQPPHASDAGGGGATPQPQRPKSLLSSSLAAGGSGTATPTRAMRIDGAGLLAAAPAPRPASAAVHYRAADAWEQLPIRTVKMQGGPPRPDAAS